MPVSAKNPLSPLYRITTSLWPTLHRDQPIPDALASPYRTPGKPSMVGVGIVNGICAVLGVQRVTSFGFQQDQWSIAITSSTNAGTTHYLGGNRTTWYVEHIGYLMAACALSGTLTVWQSAPQAQAVAQRYASFVGHLQRVLGAPPPYTYADFNRAALDQDATDALMTLSDELYFFAKTLGQTSLQQVIEQPDPQLLPTMPGAIERHLYLQTAPPLRGRSVPARPTTTMPNTAPPTLDQTMRRLIARGGTALLFGPTSGGKSTTVRRAAVAEGARLIIVRGRPNLDDRQLFGGTTATDGGFRWVDGPLTEVWRLAARERSVLLVDELLRFDPYYLNAFIGALDRITGEELMQMPRIPDATRRLLHPTHWYYVLDVPTGERLVAPAHQLSIIATTNYGSDYIQATGIDAALLNRFQLRLAVDRLARPQRLAILCQMGLGDPVARLLADLEDFSLGQCGAQGGLLQRPLTLRTVQDWAVEAQALVHDLGWSWSTALLGAAEYTILPYACPWLDTGEVEQAPAQLLREHLRDLVHRYRIP